jgi:molybdopterin converting factor subunit 1
MAAARAMSPMNRIRVMFFATLRQRAGTSSVEMEIPQSMDVGALKERLSHEYPGLTPSLQSVLTAINHEYAFDETAIPAGAEVALFPPVSGG